MKRTGCIIGIMALGLAAGAARTSPAVGRVVASAQSFHEYFRELKDSASSLSPLERFVFSLILADTATVQSPAPGRCT
jgi:hypothetical protein